MRYLIEIFNMNNRKLLPSRIECPGSIFSILMTSAKIVYALVSVVSKGYNAIEVEYDEMGLLITLTDKKTKQTMPFVLITISEINDDGGYEVFGH